MALLTHYDLARLDDSRVRERAMPLVVQYMQGIGWWTLAWFAAGLLGFVVVIHACLNDRLPLWAGFLLNAYACFVLIGPLHEAAHGNIHGDRPRFRWLNELIGHVAAVVTLICHETFKALHLLHHRHTNDPARDTNYWVVRHRGWRGALDMLLSFMHNRKEVRRLVHYTDDRRLLRAHNCHWLIVGVLAAAAVAAGYWREVVFLWLLPAVVALAAVFTVFGKLPHGKSICDGRPIDPQDLRLPVFAEPLQSLLTFIAIGHNYHLFHHVYPRVHYFHYWRASREVLPLLTAPESRTH